MTRKLPSRVNLHLREDIPPYQELVDLRRLGQTNLGTGKSISGNDLGLFSYVHLRAPLPPISNSEIFGTSAPESYFLMRRSYDGFVSCTGMFKASFPWATKKEEEEERRYVKDIYPKTSKDETAGNLWVHPADALTLAEEYGMVAWIEALLDNRPVLPTDRKRIISPPPPFYKDGVEPISAEHLAPPVTATQRRRSTRSRSSSPTKRIMSPRKSRLTKSGVGKESSLRHETLILNGTKDTESTESTVTTGIDSAYSSATVKTEERFSARITGEDLTQADTDSVIAKKDSTVRVEVDTAVQHNGDIEVETTRVKVEYPSDSGAEIPIPESAEEMIAKAKQMVEESRKLDGESVGLRKKRKADDVAEDVEDGETDAQDVPQVKKTKVLEEQLKKEKIKTKALIGLSIGLTLTALIPHFL